MFHPEAENLKSTRPSGSGDLEGTGNGTANLKMLLCGECRIPDTVSACFTTRCYRAIDAALFVCQDSAEEQRAVNSWGWRAEARNPTHARRSPAASWIRIG